MSAARYAEVTIAYVPRARLEALNALRHQLWADEDGALYDELAKSAQWGQRSPLEDDPSRKQLIPYVIVHTDRHLFRLRRLLTQAKRACTTSSRWASAGMSQKARPVTRHRSF